VQVRCTEGLANRSDPESCAGIREGVSEALTGERAGQPLSCERLKSRVPTRFETWKATRTGALWRVPGRPGVVEDPGMHGSSLYGNREILGLAGGALPVRAGKARSRSR
jgi:hypothetical protein